MITQRLAAHGARRANEKGLASGCRLTSWVILLWPEPRRADTIRPPGPASGGRPPVVWTRWRPMGGRLFPEQVRLVYKQTSHGLLATVLSAAAAFVLWRSAPGLPLALWFAAFMGLSGIRLILVYLYHLKTPPGEEAGVWLRWFIVLMLLSGGMWGYAGARDRPSVIASLEYREAQGPPAWPCA